MRQGGSALSSLGLEVSAGSAAAHGAGDAMHASRSGVARGEADADAPLRAVALERQVEERGVGALRRGPTAIVSGQTDTFSRPFAAGRLPLLTLFAWDGTHGETAAKKCP